MPPLDREAITLACMMQEGDDTNISQDITVAPPMNSCKSAASPINSIPPEIICQIFALCTLFPVRIPTSYPLPITYAPWNLLLVCSKWRQLALETSALWNNITISGCPELQILKSTLSRTGISLISLDIEVGHRVFIRNRDRKALCQEIGDVIQPYVGRFRRLSLSPADEFLRVLDLPRSTENLQSLSLIFSDDPTEYTLDYSGAYGYPLYQVIAFDNAPNLREVQILTEFATFRPNDFPLPWKQLTALHLSNTPIPFLEGHEALRQCFNLVTATLTIPSDEKCRLPPSLATLLPHLTSLEICTAREHGFTSFGQFLQPFVLPSLKQLDISGDTGDDRDIWSHSALLSLMTRSSCHLECFKASYITPQLLHAFVPVVPSLLKLSFPWVTMKPLAMFQTILREIADGMLLPNLLALECSMTILDDALKMVEARANQTDCRFSSTIINYLIVQAGRHEDPAYKIPFSNIHQLRAQGIKIVFRYGSMDDLGDSQLARLVAGAL